MIPPIVAFFCIIGVSTRVIGCPQGGKWREGRGVRLSSNTCALDHANAPGMAFDLGENCQRQFQGPPAVLQRNNRPGPIAHRL